ncbi:pyrroline-5-carboxylate reductase [Halalkalibacter okhensis]|uniref:Pyrroline-5-carboxylate reductase n=1 Tax=Halalkalibacter okhensis TaxID=333138 RepID=A0A0B0IFF9_9BACI|nr:pyrroline-5-carboxylate reductase [Halalkalibacter okhensis]KHF41313.1 pyrroline-5-carboxylate reductase [Halalkalibacter okhensis]
MKRVHLLFIGAGPMAEAIFAGVLQHRPEMAITVSNNKDTNRLEQLKNHYNIETTSNWKETVTEVDVIVLACPPSAHPDVLEQLHPLLKKDQLIVTVAAGIGPSSLEAALPKGTATAWLMPNTSADVGKSMSIYAFGEDVTEEHKKVFTSIASAIGHAQELTEEQVHNLTAVTGSAPAFLYYFVEALEQAATSYGITSEQARKLVIEMVIGSAAMLEKYRDPKGLRANVTSPGGATAAGIASLDENGFTDSLMKAIHATNKRAKELGSS